MKKWISAFFVAIIIISVSSPDAWAGGPNQTVLQFFEASKIGDVETMKQLIAGPFYERRIVLLEQNMDYPEFLSDFYAGASISVRRFEIGNKKMLRSKHFKLYKKFQDSPNQYSENKLTNDSNDAAVVILTLQLQDGDSINYKYLLLRSDDFEWKICDDIIIK